MNRQEEQFFEALSMDRSEIADVLDRRAVRGYKDSVVEKYSDQAHFIYELLQNADDAQATRARFILEGNRLIFAHNGTRHFSVSNPANEDEDSENKTLGDINSITSIANSNKKGASIGKFGVGFKAVFQYTSTPQIYDPNFRFRIERFIVPIKLEHDFPGRHLDETMFVFPFDHPERNADEAYSDISDKLKHLSYPLLFLTNLEKIDFEFDSTFGFYDKTIEETITCGNTTAEQILLAQKVGPDFYENQLWLFSRMDECERRYSVGFFMNNEGHLCPVNEPAFCFFPTKEVTNLNFILHAPFLLTDSREGIRAGVSHNDKMINLLSKLAGDSLEYLRDIGIETGTRLIEDNIVAIIPTDKNLFSDPLNKSKVSFLPFYEEIKKKFETSALLPSETGYTYSQNAYWAEFSQFPQLFSNTQLADITDNENAQWVFISFAHHESTRNEALCSYVKELVRSVINEDIIIKGRKGEYFYNRALGMRQKLENIKGIKKEFIEKQPIEWLHVFYKWLSEAKSRTDAILEKPIFLDQNNKAVAAFDKNERLILFLPVKNIDGYTFVNTELLKNEVTKKFIESIGVKEPSLKDQIYNIILPLYKKGGDLDTDRHFMMFFNYYCKCSNDEVEDFINLIKEYDFLKYHDTNNNQLYRGKADSMYFPTTELREYFEAKTDTRFIVLDNYKRMIEPDREKQLFSFLNELGVKKKIDIYRRFVDRYSDNRYDLPIPYSTRGITWEEPVIDGCEEILEYIVKKQDETKSVILWDSLLKIIEDKCHGYFTINSLLQGTVRYFYYHSQWDSFESIIAQKLKISCWLKNAEGNFVIPSDLNQDSVADIYNTSSEYAKQLMNFLKIPEAAPKENFHDNENEEDRNLTDEQREKIAFADKMKACGIEDDEDLRDYLNPKVI